jgi:membrane-bound lytic murein transglycosylase B
VSTYLSRAVSAQRIANGRAARATAPQLAPSSSSTACPPRFLLGVWGMETSYGRDMGSQDVLRSLATLAAQVAAARGRRAS